MAITIKPKRTRQEKRAKRKQLAIKTVLLVVSTLLVTFFMPRSSKFGYSYSVNGVWDYSQLNAKFKFGILKPAEVMKAEEDSIRQHFQLYFSVNDNVRHDMQYKLKAEAAQEWNGTNAHLYVKHIGSLLDTVYSHGVMSVDDYARLKASRANYVRSISQNQVTRIPISRVFSQTTAYEYIMNADTTLFSQLAMQQFNINELIAVNLEYDQQKSESELQSLIDSISQTSGQVLAGEKIVGRGDIVTPEVYEKLQSYEHEIEKLNNVSDTIPFTLVGQIVFVFAMFFAITMYLSMFRKDYFTNISNAIIIYALPTLFCVAAALMVNYKFQNVFMLPVCMVPIIIRVFQDSRTAFFVHCCMTLIISTMLVNNFEFVILQFTAGVVTIQTLRELSERSQIFRTAFFIFLVYVVVYLAYSMMHENNKFAPETYMFIYLAINGVLLLFTYPLLWMVERTFGFTSDVSLVELSSFNHPLLRKLSEEAAGTLQHSMQVATLGAEVAKKIDAKPQLVRAGALYHDVGKLFRPVLFVENQNGASPHKHMNPESSAKFIIDHVAQGLALAEHYHLPEVIKRFIRTHHGRGKTKYFYVTYKNLNPDKEVDDDLFTYPGPNPQSKEEAILMMCDAVEAASRSLPEYNDDTVGDLVEKIVNGQMADGFFNESDISFREIETAKSVLKNKLMTIYHTRVSYPELNKDNTEGNSDKDDKNKKENNDTDKDNKSDKGTANMPMLNLFQVFSSSNNEE